MSEQRIVHARLFPLDGVVLFPGTIQLFHIFEERYRSLVAEALSGDQTLAIPLLKPGWEKHYFGTPEVNRIAGLGRILDAEILGDGRYNIAVKGSHRIRLLREIQHTPHRVAEAEIIETVVLEEDRKTITVELSTVWQLTQRLCGLFPQFRQVLDHLSPASSDPSELVDTVAGTFVRDTYDRQSILAELDLCRRLQLTRVQLLLLMQRFLTEDEYARFTSELAENQE